MTAPWGRLDAVIVRVAWLLTSVMATLSRSGCRAPVCTRRPPAVFTRPGACPHVFAAAFLGVTAGVGEDFRAAARSFRTAPAGSLQPASKPITTTTAGRR